MKKVLILLAFFTILIVEKTDAQPNKEIEPYVSFLNNQKLSAKEYIIQLFDRYDIVVFCERDHDEVTQYDLLLSIIRSQEFQHKVGNIFMEIGGSNFDKPINDYLLSPGLTLKESSDKALSIQRDMSWYPLWNRYNYHYLLTGLYDINKSLPASEKIKLHPTDIAIDWNKIKTAEEVKSQIQNRIVQTGRDSVMAKNILGKIEEINKQNTKRKKYFIILNSAHATHGDYVLMGSKIKSATSYLFEKYPTQTFNVLSNFENLLFLKNPAAPPPARPVMNGKWDAAFEYSGIDDKGFDIKNSPLEKQRFENMSMEDSNATNQDVFTGYVFYKSAPKQENVNGNYGIINENFAKELFRRDRLWNPSDTTAAETWRSYIWEENIIKKKNVEGLAEYWKVVMQWLKEE